ncbi:unnamed protein product, partial [Brassica oleracea]|uniref:(rape) hypothetical protein n=1 Tax=Brassica napus TaxID=3708 RepID=A0A816PYI9_BRANA|nr:unnamed protein product [Brassica napus]
MVETFSRKDPFSVLMPQGFEIYMCKKNQSHHTMP